MGTRAVLPRDAAAARDDRDARRAARLRVYELIRSAQLTGGLTGDTVRTLIGEAEDRGWADVVRLGMFLGIFCERQLQGGSGTHWVQALYERAHDDGDAAMTALALAVRAQDVSSGDGHAPVDADHDLARATALLETVDGPSSEAVSAHIECAYACECRDLWELQLRHYEAAEAQLDWDESGPERHQVLLYNRAETEVTWTVALRERGPCPELSERAESARTAIAAAQALSMPDSWREDLTVFAELVDAISPPRDGGTRPPRMARGRYAGFIHLVRALQADAPAPALAHCKRGIALIDPAVTARIHLFSLALAVELEAAIAGHETAALRWGRELVTHRWDRRLAALSSMESLVEIERKEAEHALLHRHAYLDDLTGLANRRALARFVQDERDNHGAIALIDLDRFKAINDTYGHAAGDEVLVGIAEILRGAVREQDLVVRLGGDEFLLVLMVSELSIAQRRCASIVAAINATLWPQLGDGMPATASVGVAHGALEDFDGLAATADAALYRAKRAGGARAEG